MKNAAHRVAVSTRIKTVNGDKINAVGWMERKKGAAAAASAGGSHEKGRRCENENAPATPSLTHAGGMKRLREGWTMRP
jgi:hypothetical protein